MKSFLEKRLKLKVNLEKSAVDRPWTRPLLGFTFVGPEVSPAKHGLIASQRSRAFGTMYRDRVGYGVSLTSPAWVREQARRVGTLREVSFKDRGWEDHQDVYGLVGS